MNVYEAIRARRSVRRYKPDPVSEEALGRILEAVRQAPSGNNRQPWKFVVVRDPQTRRELSAAARNQRFVAEAPVVIAAVGQDPERIMACGVPGDPVNLAIALDHLALAAVEEGLGTCWIGAFLQDPVRRILGVPDDRTVIELMTLGHPDDEPREKIRKPLDEIVCYERYA